MDARFVRRWGKPAVGEHRSYRVYDYAFGNLVLRYRTRAALTQSALAQQLGVHRRSVQNWETGASYPKLETLQRLIAVLLRHGAFSGGSERAEAQELWERAANDGLREFGAFDEVWFGRLAAHTAGGAHDYVPLAGPLALSTGERLLPAAAALPYRATQFVGRERELAQLARTLDDPACRLVTLLGPGGIGKTRLALELAAALAPHFDDGVAFVGLAAVDRPEQIVAAIGAALQLSPAGQAGTTSDMLAALRHCHMLLLLDNFEHLLDGAEVLNTLLQHNERLSVLVTSRERLKLQAEWLFDVEGLSYPAPGLPLDQAPPIELLDYSAVQLFVQRARQVRPDFASSAAELAAAAQICASVAGMPLAIELAAANVRSVPVGVMAGQIGSNLDLLSTALRDVPPRHRSLRAVFDHSWALLSDAERTLLSCMSVFRGGCTFDAAEQVAGATRATLTALVEKSLLREEREERWSADDPDRPATRLVMQAPIREYALEQLAAGPDGAAVRLRHALYYTALAEQAAADWDTPRLNAAITRQRLELDNVRQALQWAVDTAAGEQGLRLAVSMWGFWRSYGYGSEGRAWFDRLLQLAPHPGEQPAVAARKSALHAAAWLASDQHDYAVAEQLFAQSMALRGAAGDADGDVDMLLNAARQARAAGQYVRATVLLEDALERHHRGSDLQDGSKRRLELSIAELGQIRRELGLVLRERGQFESAVAHLSQALELHRAIGDGVSAALAQLGLGDVARDLGDSAGVRAGCEPGLAVFRELDMQWAIGFALNNLAAAALYDGELPRAIALERESEALFTRLGNHAALAELLLTRGSILLALGDTTAAGAALLEALRRAQQVGPRLLLAASLEGLAVVASRQARAGQAVQLLAAAAALREEMGAPVRPADRPRIEAALAAAREQLGEPAYSAAWASGAQPLDEIAAAL